MCGKLVSWISNNFRSPILHTLKVLHSYLFSKQVNRCQGDGFSSVNAQMGAIKLAMAGTQD